MADNTNVGTASIGLDIQATGDLKAQIESVASNIGEQIQEAIGNIGFDFSGVANTISASIEKTITNSITNIQQNLESSISKAMANIKGITIPVDYGIPQNLPSPWQGTRSRQSQLRAPPNVVNLEELKAEIDNVTASLDNTNAKIEQQQAKLAVLKEDYDLAFNEERKNKILEQILNTEAAINKLTANSDKLGFQLSNLDEQFDLLSNSINDSEGSLNEEDEALNEVSKSANKASNSMSRFGSNAKSAGNSTNTVLDNVTRMLDRMMLRMFLFNTIIKGLTNIGKYISAAFMTNQDFANSLLQIKSNLEVAFQPIYNAVLPAINSLMQVLATVSAYIASFTSQLFGSSYSASFNSAQHMQNAIGAYDQTSKAAKKAANSLGSVGKSTSSTLNGISKAANQVSSATKKGLAGFDQINKLGGNTSKAGKTGTPAGSGIVAPIAPTVNMAPVEASTLGWANKLRSILAGIWAPFQEAWAAEGQNTINAAKHALGGIMDSLGSIGKSFLTVWDNGTGTLILTNILKIFQDIFNIIGDIAEDFANAWNKGNIGTQIIQSIGNSINNVLSLIDKMGQSVRNVLAQEMPTFANMFMQTLKATTGVIENVTQKLGWIWDHGGQHAFEGLIKLGLKVGELALYIYTNFVTPFVNWFVNSISPAIAIVLNILGTLFDSMSKIINWLMSSGKPVLDMLIATLGTIWLGFEIFDGVKSIMSGVQIAMGLVTNAGYVLRTCIGLLNMVMEDNPYGIVIVTLGVLVGALFTLWNTNKGFRDFIINMWNVIKNTVMGAINAVGSAFSGLGNTISSFANGIGTAIENGFRSAVNYITSLPNMAVQWGKDFINGLVNGINGAVSNITNAVSNVASTITSFLHFSVPDKGPLTQYESWMPDFMGGLAKGINSNKHLVTDAISGLSSNVSVGVQAGLQQPQLAFAPNSNQVQSNAISSESAASNTNDISEVLRLLQSIIDILNSLNSDIKVDGDTLAKIVIKQLNKRRRQVGKTELIL
ncbi:hypothetical protein [Clostridium sp.]|uniref:hypothetical protein n=1 Tax=Clostridium sp. TaxID=1506 RepID=UPI002628634C|nr:hypothetical protein [Clostridium sp.]